MIKLSEIYIHILKENTSLDITRLKEFEKVGEKLVNDKKLIAIVSDLMDNNPNVLSILDKKVGKLLPSNENISDFDLDYNALHKLSLDISKDVDINESIQTTLKVASKVLNLLGLNSVGNVVKVILNNFLTDGIVNNLPIEQSGTISQIEFIISICVVIYTIMMNLKKQKYIKTI